MRVDKSKWQKKTIQEFCRPKSNIRWRSDNNKTYKYIDLTSVDRTSHKICNPSEITAVNAPSRAKQIINTGDVIFATTRPLQLRCCIIPSSYDNEICSTGFCLIKPNKVVTSKWLFYNLISRRFSKYLEPRQSGATYPAITDKDVLNYCILVPSLSEQQAITSELDAVQAMIDGYREQLADLDALAQSLFLDTFGDPITNSKGWEVKPLSYFGKIITGSTPSTKDSENYSSDDFPFVKPSDLSEELRYIDKTEFYISSKAHNNARILPMGTVMVTCIGIIGKIGVSKSECSSNQQINSIIVNLNNNNIYVAYAIIGIRDLMKKKANGPVVPLINKSQFSQFLIPVPPLELQQQFAAQVEAIEKQKELLRQQIADAETLMAERMQYYFS